MSTGDYLAIGILAVFALVGVLGGFRWVLQCLLGLTVGCVILVALSRAGGTWALGGVSDLLNDGHVAPALTQRAERALQTHVPPPSDAQPADATSIDRHD